MGSLGAIIVDITSVALLSMFGSAIAGGLVGMLVGRFTRFEAGMAVGLLIFGGVTLTFAWKCFGDYRAFVTAGANGLWGEVVKVIDKPSNDSGSITSPAPIVKIEAPDGNVYFIEGPTASGAKVGEHLNVIFDRERPERSRIGNVSELRGGAIALMLFGTFPTSFAFLMIASVIEEVRSQRRISVSGARQTKRGESRSSSEVQSPLRNGGRSRFGAIPLSILFATLFCSIVWIGMTGAPLLDRFMQGFVGITASLVGYAIWGWVAGGVGFMWSFGMLLLALNFGVWAFALHLLR